MPRQINIQSLVRENVKKLRPYASARDDFNAEGSPMVFLDANENPYQNGVNRYPDPQQRKLKTVLAEQRGLHPSQLLLGNGSDEVLDLLIRAFCEPGRDHIITLPPTYGMYQVLAGINGVENREIELNTSYEPRVDAILKTANERSRMLILCSPNNPTGNLFPMPMILRLLEEFNGLVVIDEAYIEFSKAPSLSWKLGEYENLVVTQTLSKAYGMAGIRLGICCASPELISVLNRIKPPYNVNELTQERALQGVLAQQLVQEQLKRILEQREFLLTELAALDCVLTVFPSDANFLLLRVDDAGRWYKTLLRQGIVVRNRSSQPLCENTLRITVGTEVENRKLITALKSLS